MRPFLPYFMVLLTVLAYLSSARIAADDAVPAARSPNRALSILKQPSVRRELELSFDQIEDLIHLEVVRQDLFRGPLANPQQATVAEREAAYTAFKLQLNELEKQALEVLQPHQRKRLGQILLQEMVHAFEPRAGVTHPQLASRLGVVEPQLEAVRQAIIAAEKEFDVRKEELLAELNRAKEEARLKVLAELTPEQRATYEELIGKPYDLTKRD